MIEVDTGSTALLELVLVDGDTSRFPQVEIYDSAGVAIGASPVDLTSTAGGLYQGTVAAPAAGAYSCIFITYSDAGHTTLVGNIERVSDHLRVVPPVAESVWGEPLPGAFGAGEAGQILGDNLDDLISTRAAPGDAMDLTSVAVDDIWDEALAGHLSAGSTGLALDTAAAGGGGLTQQQVRDAMKLAPTAGAPGVGSIDEHLDDIDTNVQVMEPIVSTNLDDLVSSRATQADIINDATPFAGADIANILADTSNILTDTADILTDTATMEPLVVAMEPLVTTNLDATVSSRSTLTQADILSDATPFQGADVADILVDTTDILAHTSTMEPLVTANLDATVSSRATQAQILSDATPFPGADIDAAISTRSNHTAADVDALVTVSHGVGSYLSATGFAVAGDAMSLTSGGVDLIWDELIAGHLGVGSVGEALNDASSGAGVDWTVSERSQMRQALGITGATLATAAGELQDILADTAAIEPLTTLNLDATVSSRSTLAQTDIVADSVPFDGANVDAAISSRGTADPGDAMTLTAGERTAIDGVLTASHGAGSWASGAGITQQDVRDAMKLAPTAGAPAAGSVDTHLDDIEADTSAIEPLTTANLDAAVSTRSTQAQILSDATPFPGASIDALISSRGTADPGDAMALTPAERTAIDTELTAAHGAGSWAAGGGLTQQDVRDSMLLSPTAGAPAAGSVDEHLDTIESDIGTLNNLSAADVENAVWDAAKTGHIAAGSLGEAVTLAAAHAGVDVVLDGGAGFASVQIDADNNLIGARLRAFGSSALANAATLGAADGADGELKRFDVTANYVNGNATPTVKVLTDMVRVVT